MPDSNDKQFRIKLLETFEAEAREHISAIAARLTELERAPESVRAPIIEVAFREAHSLKAAARAVNRREIERVCQGIEAVFAAFKRGEAAPSRVLLDALHRANDALGEFLAAGERGDAAQGRLHAENLVRVLETARSGERRDPAQMPQMRAEPQSAAGAGSSDTVRLPAQRLDALLKQAEELLLLKLQVSGQAQALKEVLSGFGDWRKRWSGARGAIEGLGAVPQARSLVDFLRWHEAHIAALEAALAGIEKAAGSGARAAATRVDGLLRSLKQILMMEVRGLLDAFPKAVRELARDQRKEVDFFVEGGELQIDRRILEEIREPLLHLLRNAVDHGIENPDERVRQGKSERASLRLTVSAKDNGKVEFAIADDGAGVPLKKLAASASKLGLLPAERAAAAGEAELLPLVFQSGISTSPIITELSGRGLGLAIVRERVERLGGTVALETREGRGTTFRLVVPLTLATFRGIPVRAAEQIFVVPSFGVERVLRAKREAVRTIENRPAIALNGAHIPLVALADTLEIASLAAPAGVGEVQALVLGAAAERVAFEVDEIFGDQEVLVKPLGRALERVRNVAGATVLADGRIAPILSVHDLLKSARRPRSASAAAGTPVPAEERRLRVLVVEDSITARGLLKNILEAAGYQVRTAVDGVDAWSALRLETFDLVVSDVEMPRMNGFSLTERIRADKRLSELPVVLVTALESREDRERGVQSGANAYIPKGDFDQQKLLEVLRRLA